MMKEGNMKFKIWSILVILILVLIVCSDGKNVQSDVAKMNFSGPGLDWLLTKVPEPYTLDELEKIFEERNLKLSKYFEEKQFDKIGEYYGPIGWIKTHNNDVVKGTAKIEEYLAELSGKAVLKEFRSIEILIDVDKHLYENPSQNPAQDPVYPIIERIKIIVDMENHSLVKLDSSASYGHSRKTFK